MGKRKRTTKRLWKLREETQRKHLARLMFLGLSTAKCAARMHVSADTIRDLAATPEYQRVYQGYEAEMMQTVDRAMPRLLIASIEALHRMLTHRDWRANESALRTILLPYGKVLERLLDQRSPEPKGSTHLMLPAPNLSMDDMDEATRAKAVDVLQWARGRHLLQAPPDLSQKLQKEPGRE